MLIWKNVAYPETLTLRMTMMSINWVAKWVAAWKKLKTTALE